jgi:hypothetical protein
MLKCGDTFLAPKSSAEKEHLWVIITDPDAEGKAVGVNITSLRSYSETTLVLDKGDHRFITHPSVVNYGLAQILDIRAVHTAIEKKPKYFVCKSHDPCSPELLKKVQDGMLRSKQAPKDIKQRCASEWEAKAKS